MATVVPIGGTTDADPAPYRPKVVSGSGGGRAAAIPTIAVGLAPPSARRRREAAHHGLRLAGHGRADRRRRYRRSPLRLLPEAVSELLAAASTEMTVAMTWPMMLDSPASTNSNATSITRM